MDFKPCRMATGIGSVPHINAEEAVKFAVSYFLEIPYWPQLPARDVKEVFLNQFLNPLVELGVLSGQVNKYYVDTERKDWGAALARFYEIYMAATAGNEEALKFFELPEEKAAGFYAMLRYLESFGTGNAKYLKGQIFGPSIGLVLTDQDGKPVNYNPQVRDILVKTIALQSLFQVKTLSRFGLPVIFFVDDGNLSATGGIFNLQRNEVIAEYNQIYEVIQGAGALTGTHCCAIGDWSILFESKVDIVSFDAYKYFTSLLGYIDSMKNYLDRGGVLAWGIVPTSPEKVGSETVVTLAQRLAENIDNLARKGIDRQLVLEQALITPSCGTGTLPMDVAVRVHELTRDLYLI